MINASWTTRALAALLMMAVLAPFSGASAAQEPGTPVQKRACRPDVYRLCAAEIPSVRAIVRCLKSNMSRLSPDCRAVFEDRVQ
jgi:hypothetical protein